MKFLEIIGVVLKMVKVVFVGDSPSNSNIDADIAFVGAKCFDRLVEWIGYLEPDYYVCLNSGPQDLDKVLKLYHKADFKVIALGVRASERLGKLGIGHRILPHPSGLNRQLNDKEAVDKALAMCKDYLLDYPVSGAV